MIRIAVLPVPTPRKVRPGAKALIVAMLAAVTGGFAWHLTRKRAIAEVEEAQAEAEAKETAEPVEEPISTALAIDDLRIELGYGLLGLINNNQGYRLTDQIKALRRQIASDVGFVMPSVRILDNMQLSADEYAIRVKEVEAARGELRTGKLLVMDPTGGKISLHGEPTTEPAFGLPAMWVDETLREEASFRGYTVVDAPTVVTTHLTELIKDNMADLLSYAATQKLLDDLPPQHSKLVDDIVPSQISITAIQRVLQRLLAERVSIRDLPTILEGIAEAVGFTQNIVQIAEHVRARLARQISHATTTANGYVPLITLSPEWEQTFAESVIGQGDDRQLAMAPSRLQEFIARVRQVLDEVNQQGEIPVLLTSPAIRPFVRSIIERFRPSTMVLSQNEIHPQAKIRTLSQV